MSDQLLPPGSFKPPTRADFKDDSVPSGEVKPSGDIVARSKVTLRCPGVPTPRFSILQSEDRVRTYAVLDRIDRVVAFTAYANRAVEILKDAQLNPSQSKKSWCWTPFIHSEEYIEMTEEEIRAATIAPDAPNGTDSQTTGTGGKSPAGVFTGSPSITGSCVGASAKPSGHRQLPITSDDATQQFSMATVVGGQYRGRWAIIYVEFADGLCLVELDQKQTMEEEIRVIHRDFLLIWATCLATDERKE